MTSREIRDTYLQFFKSKGHEIVPSAPVVIKNDPTLMFTNAGMNQFKALFLGEEAAKFPRVADTQRCLRVSGKHNDLEEVGIDTYHHTLFEMLGNWSFGDYFKKEAIAWSWELLTKVYSIDPDRMYVTVFEGDASEGLAMDQEAFDYWKAIIPESKILMGNKKDNFWEMGETGPCGPCSEIHVDCRSDEERNAVDGTTLVNADHPQVIEIWNLVFMQFNRQKDRSLQRLPSQHVDTGMGFERLVRVIQGEQSNYDTDVFQPTIQFISTRCGIPYGQAEPTDIAMRVMSDHIRAICFAIADGQLPSNNKAGYVIRRILRRAVRYAYTFLGFKEPFLYELVPLLAKQFEGVFDELNTQVSFVQKVVLEEEAAFLRTLVLGVQRFENYVSQNPTINGDFAFELYDTFGFPIDLTELLAREKGLKVDMEGFQRALDAQKDRSRAATTIDTGDWVQLQEGDQIEFIGYDDLECTTSVLKYRKVEAKGSVQYQLVLEKTPFYAEGGGQVGDTGWLISSDGRVRLPVTDTKKENALTVHYISELPAVLDQEWVAQVDVSKRKDSQRNHTATHLLHAALKQLVGSHVNQKGSLVSPDILRFDISHFSKLTSEELSAIEALVNEKIRENIPLMEARQVPLQEALDAGITGLFGEKYGDFVRVITFDPAYSRELCGGTHVKATGEIGYFKIISESAVAAGVRRIEAITGTRSANVIQEQFELFENVGKLLHNPKDFVSAISKLVDDNQGLRKEIEKQFQEKALQLKSTLLNQMEQIGDVNFLAARVDLPSAETVKTLAYALKGAFDRLVLVIGAEHEGKPSLTLVISESLVAEKQWNAGNLIRGWAKHIQGGGGGQAFFATAGGKDAAGLDKALEEARNWIKT